MTFKYGKALPDRTRSGSGFPVYGSNGVVGYHSEALTDSETIVVGRKGSVGEINYSVGPCSPIDTTYFVDDLHGMPFRYWNHQLKSLDLANLNKSTAIPGLNREDAYAVEISLPPLPEQVRIADKLDALLARVDAGRERLERVPKLVKGFRQAVLSAAVSGELTREWRGGGETEWEDKPLGLVVRDVEQGWSPQCDKEPALAHEWGVIKTTAIQHMSFDANENKKLPASLKPRTDLEISQGDILITRAGPRVRAGVACVVKQTRGKLILCDKAYRMRARENVALPQFVEIVLNEPLKLAEINSLKTGISESGVNLTQSRFLGLSVQIPPLPEQAEIVRRVEALFAIADRLEQRYHSALISFDRLTPALLAKAFRGELVPQDPNDEPASKLLERIRAQRAAEGAGAKRGRGAGRAKVGDGTEPKGAPKRRGRPPKAQAEAGSEGAEPRRRGRPPGARPESAIPQASSYEEAVRQLEAQKAARAGQADSERAPGTRLVGLFED